MTHHERGRTDALTFVARYGLNHAVAVAQAFRFTDTDLYDGGFSYAAGYLSILAKYGGPL